MTQSVFALLKDDPAAPLLFAWRDLDAWRSGPSPPANAVAGAGLTVFVPGLDVVCLTALIPARTDAEARRAAPFAIEDDVAEPIETLHVALGPHVPGDATRRCVHVVGMSRMAAWIQRLDAEGFPEAALVATHAVLPEGAALFEGPGEILGRTGPSTFALDRDAPPDVFASLFAPGDTVSVHGDELAQRIGRPAAGPGCPSDQALLIRLAEWSAGTLINLRQGAFGRRRRFDMSRLGEARGIAAMTALIAALFMASQLLEISALEQRTARLNAGMQASAQDLPEAGADMTRALAIARAEIQTGQRLRPTTLLAALYAALPQVEGAQLRSVRYEASTGRLTASVSYEDFVGADRLRAAIETAGFAAHAGDARQSGDRVLGELVLEARS